MTVKIPDKALKLNAVAECFDKIREEKELLILLLMKLAPNSFPIKFRSYLEEIVLPKVLADSRYVNYFPVIYFGFNDIDHLKEEIKLLQEAWRGMISISFNETTRIPHAVYMEFDPIL
ncbi:MAG: hypothetical protein NTW46_02135 [Candidatus Nealsonbacteria bacterium]|nr:hypothetical protein [Candidatus Nealsonbacteria bacterium]